MKQRRAYSILVALSLILGLFVTQVQSAEAGAPSGIAGNGTGGIFIDINAAPYTDYANIPNWGRYAYGTAGCAWFASARVNQLTGVNCTIYSGKSWYNSAYASFGFSRGNVLNAKALACYENHVAVVESVNGNTAVVSEGGYTSVNSSNGYCVIHTMSKAELESARGGGFLGYVYLTGGAPQPAGSLSYSDLHTTFVDAWNAGLYGYINNPGRLTVSEVGVFVWDSAGILVVNHKEGCGLKTSYVEQQLNIVGEALPSGLKSGETYTYQMYAVANGTTYKSDIGTFTLVDNEKPKISNIKVTDVSSDGYTISCTVTDNHQVVKVQFPVWTDANGQDDLPKDWATNSKSAGVKNGSTYTFRVNISDHNNESGIYHTHIYAWDKAGNQTIDIVPDTKVPERNITPQPTPGTAVSSPAPGTEPPSIQQPAITPEPDYVQSTNYINSYLTNLTDTTVILNATIPSQYMTEWGIYFGKSPFALQKYFGNTPNRNITSMTYSFTKGISPDTRYYYYFYYSTGTKTVASKLYSFATKKSNSSSSQDFDSVITTKLTDTEASFKITVPLCYMDSCGYYFGEDSNNLQKYVIEDNMDKTISWMTFERKNLMPDTTYYFYMYYVTKTRTVVSEQYHFTTKSGQKNPDVITTPEKVFLYEPYSNEKKTMYVEWRMDSNADGYQIQYATSKKFKSAKKAIVTSWNSGSKKLTKLQSKKRYYVRVRAYRNSAGNKLYGEWSVVKSCKIK